MGFIIFLILQPAFLNEMSIEATSTYITAIGLIPKPLRQLSEINGVIQKGIAAAESVFEILDLPKEINTGTQSADGVARQNRNSQSHILLIPVRPSPRSTISIW